MWDRHTPLPRPEPHRGSEAPDRTASAPPWVACSWGFAIFVDRAALDAISVRQLRQCIFANFAESLQPPPPRRIK